MTPCESPVEGSKEAAPDLAISAFTESICWSVEVIWLLIAPARPRQYASVLAAADGGAVLLSPFPRARPVHEPGPRRPARREQVPKHRSRPVRNQPRERDPKDPSPSASRSPDGDHARPGGHHASDSRRRPLAGTSPLKTSPGPPDGRTRIPSRQRPRAPQ